MNRTTLRVGLLTLGLCSGVCEGGVNVVATTADFGSLAREIGGDRVSVTVLAQPAEDVHFVSPKPSYIARLARADLLIEGGAELEIGWLPPLVDGSRNAKLMPGQPGRVACAEGLTLLEVPAELDRSHGDVHAMGNPHYMVDPVNARHAAVRIAAALQRIDPAGEALYRERLGTLTNRLDARLIAWQQRLAPFRGARIAAYHNSWPYFGARFGLAIDLFLEPKPGIPPSPAHLARVVGEMKRDRIRAILVEPYQDCKVAKTVAAKTGAAQVEFCQYPGGLKGTEDGYIALMDHLVEALAGVLEGAGANGEAKP